MIHIALKKFNKIVILAISLSLILLANELVCDIQKIGYKT